MESLRILFPVKNKKIQTKKRFSCWANYLKKGGKKSEKDRFYQQDMLIWLHSYY